MRHRLSSSTHPRARLRAVALREGLPMTGHEHDRTNASEEISVNPMFARGGETAIPRWRIPDGEMLPDSAYQIIHDEILLDGNARQNLATFVTTWMEPQAAQLYAESF